MPHRDSAFAVLSRAGSVLVVRAGTKWKLPGGALKKGEAPWTAAQREVREETGLHARIDKLTGVYRRTDGSLAFVFVARIEGRRTPAGPRNEIREQKWMRIGAALRLLSRRARRRLLDATRPGAARRIPFALRLTAG